MIFVRGLEAGGAAAGIIYGVFLKGKE